MVAERNQVGEHTLTMKRIAISSFGAVAALVIILNGCVTGPVPEGQEEWVIRAEQTHDMAFILADAFLLFEKENRQALWDISPDYKHVADNIRSYSEAFVLTHDALEQYKALRHAARQLKQKRKDPTEYEQELINAAEEKVAGTNRTEGIIMDTAIEFGFKLLDSLLENLPKLINKMEQTGELSKEQANEKRAHLKAKIRQIHWLIEPDPE